MVRNDCGERRLSMLRLGLNPAWRKDSGIGHKLINTQAETAEVTPSFPAAFSKRRCLVPVNGFCEWRREGSVREPWLIAWPDEGVMAFAELWERWRVIKGAELRGSFTDHRPGDAVETFTIFTTEANETMRALQHRTPVILSPEAFEPWHTGEGVRFGSAPKDLSAMRWIDRRVKNARNDDPECLVATATA